MRAKQSKAESAATTSAPMAMVFSAPERLLTAPWHLRTKNEKDEPIEALGGTLYVCREKEQVVLCRVEAISDVRHPRTAEFAM